MVASSYAYEFAIRGGSPKNSSRAGVFESRGGDGSFCLSAAPVSLFGFQVFVCLPLLVVVGLFFVGDRPS